MKIADEPVETIVTSALQRNPPLASGEVQRLPNPQRGKVLLAAGLLGVLSAAFILAAPELGIGTAIGGTLLAGIGSAGMTLIARR